MQQTNTRQTNGRERGLIGARIVSTVLVMVMILSMSVSAYASVGSNGQSVQPSPHMDFTVHTENCSALPKETNPGGAPWTNVDDRNYGGTVYLKVGETVTLHLLQRGVALFGVDSLVMPQWYGANGRDFEATVGIKSTLDGKQNSEVLTYLKKYEAKNDYNDYNTAYCMDLTLTGKKPGTEYFYYSDGGGAIEGSFYKVVVTGDGSGAQNTSDDKKQEEKTQNTGTKDSGSTPSTPKTTTSSDFYTVQAGDTLAKIALNVYGDMSYWPQLQEANREYLNQTKDGIIFAGFNLYLPGDIGNGRIPAASAGTGEKLYTVKAGDTFGSIALDHFGDMSRYPEIFNRNSDRVKDVYTLMEGQIIVLP